MPTPWRNRLAQAALIRLLVVPVAVAGSPSIAGAHPGYAIAPLRPASPFDYAVPNAINAHGDITGYAVIDSNSEFHAFLVRAGAFQDLGLLGYGGTTGIAVNGTDQVALDGETPGVAALLLSGGQTTTIGNVDGGSSWVTSVNDSGDVVGGARNGDNQNVGFSWIGGVFTDLSTVGMYKTAAINDARQIVGTIGYYWTYGGYIHSAAHGCLYSGGVVTDVGSIIGDPRTDTEALALDASGDVVGYSTAADGSHHAFLYRSGTIQDLGTLPGDYASAIAINDGGLILGTLSNPYNVPLGSFLYSGGTMYDFGSLVTSGGTGWTQLIATGLNNAGVVVGYGTFNDTTQGFVALPAQLAGLGPAPAPMLSALREARPNPFRAATEIDYTLSAPAADGPVRLDVFDAAGRRLATLARGAHTAGPQVARWDGLADDGSPVPGGVYFVRLTTRDGSATRRLVVLH